jgi:hypothetical protein
VEKLKYNYVGRLKNTIDPNCTCPDPRHNSIRIGSYACQKCIFNLLTDKKNKTIHCSFNPMKEPRIYIPQNHKEEDSAGKISIKSAIELLTDDYFYNGQEAPETVIDMMKVIRYY